MDIEYLRRLSPLTNVIPLIAHADTLPQDKLDSLKVSVLSELQAAGIRPFTFETSFKQGDASSRPSPPYSISTIPTSDDENMDASLLMSPDYVQPLIPTELAALVEQIFDHDSISWLRYSAAKKCVQWCKGSLQGPTGSQIIPTSLIIQSPSPLMGNSQVVTSPIGATNTYALARITDHTQREERLAQVRLSKWANDLQRSLQNERARFEALAKGERAVWLTERLNECVQDGTLVPISASRRKDDSPLSGIVVKQGSYSLCTSRGASLDKQDPLGLVQFNAEMRRRSWAALQIVGGFGIVGGLAIWWVKNWNTENGHWAWGWDWTRLMLSW